MTRKAPDWQKCIICKAEFLPSYHPRTKPMFFCSKRCEAIWRAGKPRNASPRTWKAVA